MPVISTGTGETSFLTSPSMGFENTSVENFLVLLQGSDEKMRSGCTEPAERWQTACGLAQPLERTSLPSLCLSGRNFVGISSGTHQGFVLIFLQQLY